CLKAAGRNVMSVHVDVHMKLPAGAFHGELSEGSRNVKLNRVHGEFSDLDLRLSIMDHQGVDMQALAPAGSFFWMPAANGLEYARWLNDRFAEAVAKHPRRFVGLASVPMQDGALAAVELERAIAKLGLRGAEIASNINGRYSDDPASNLSGRRRKRWMR
ncbi:MAG TPA: amidohydrolase family protein, partial [Candidatus Binatia bacterium]